MPTQWPLGSRYCAGTALFYAVQALVPAVDLGPTVGPLPNLDITVDGYQIEVDHRISITSTLTGTAVSAILAAHGLSPDLSAQYYTNAIDTRTRGVDAVATYTHDLGDYGDLHLTADAHISILADHAADILTDLAAARC